MSMQHTHYQTSTHIHTATNHQTNKAGILVRRMGSSGEQTEDQKWLWLCNKTHGWITQPSLCKDAVIYCILRALQMKPNPETGWFVWGSRTQMLNCPTEWSEQVVVQTVVIKRSCLTALWMVGERGYYEADNWSNRVFVWVYIIKIIGQLDVYP